MSQANDELRMANAIELRKEKEKEYGSDKVIFFACFAVLGALCVQAFRGE